MSETIEPTFRTPAPAPFVAAEPAAAAPEPAAAAEPAALAFAPHTETSTLLETIPADAPAAAPAHETPPAEVSHVGETAAPVATKAIPKADAEKPAEPTLAETAVAPRVYEPFTLPEGIRADDKALDAYREVAGRHNLDQEAAQGLLDLHTSTLRQYADTLLAEQHRAFADTRKQWQDEVRADEQLGGAGFETSLKAVARMRDMLVPPDRRGAFEQFLRTTGAGDHPEFLRILHNAARLFDEPAPPAVQARPAPQGQIAGNRRAAMYDHPSSIRAAGR